ncbi:hypothetical protein BaRGS_00039057, partial [Batillaria attramentaria]
MPVPVFAQRPPFDVGSDVARGPLIASKTSPALGPSGGGGTVWAAGPHSDDNNFQATL